MEAKLNIKVYSHLRNHPDDEVQILSVDLDPETNTIEILI